MYGKDVAHTTHPEPCCIQHDNNATIVLGKLPGIFTPSVAMKWAYCYKDSIHHQFTRTTDIYLISLQQILSGDKVWCLPLILQVSKCYDVPPPNHLI